MHKRIQQQKAAAKPGNGKPSTGTSITWKSLIGAVDLLLRQCSTLSSSDVADSAQELSRELNKSIKSKFNHSQRIQCIELIHGIFEEYMTVICTATPEQQKSIEFTPLLESLYTSALGVLGTTIDDAGGNKKSVSEKQKQSEYELIGLLQLIEVLLGSSISQNQTARELFAPHYIPIVQVCMDLAVTDVRSFEVRNIAIKLIETLIDIDGDAGILINKDNQQSRKLLEYIVGSCFDLCSDANDELIDAEEFQSVDLGTELLDAVLQTLHKSESVVLQCVDKCKSIISTGNVVTQRHEIKGAVSIIGVLPDYIAQLSSNVSTHAKDIQLILTPLLTSKDSYIRGAAYVSQSELIEYLYSQSPDIQSIVPILLNNISSTIQDTKQDITIRIKSTLPLSKLFASLDLNDITLQSTVSSIIQSIAQQSNKIITSKKTELEDAELLESYLLVLRAVIINSYKSKSTYFQQHTDSIVTLLDTLLQSNDELFHGCRANATLVYAELCDANDTDWVKHVLQSHKKVMKYMLDNYSIPHYNIRAATHAFFAKAVLHIKSDILPHIELLVDAVERALDIEYSISGAAHHSHDQEGEEEEEEEEEGEEGEEGDDPEEITAERTCALLLYKSLIQTLRSDFASYNNKLFATLYASARDYDEEIRNDVCQVLGDIPQLCNLPTVQPGVTTTLKSETKQLLKQTLQLLYFYIHYASESEFVIAALNGISKFLSQSGQTPLMQDDHSLDTLVQLIKTLLKGKNLCQQSYGSAVPPPDSDDLVLRPDVFGIDMNDYYDGEHGDGDSDDDDSENDGENAPELVAVPSGVSDDVIAATERSNADPITVPLTDDYELLDSMSHVNITPHTHSAACGTSCSSSIDTSAQPQPLETAVIDCLIQLAKVRGPSFDVTLDKLYPALTSTFTNDKYHSYSIGAMGEFALAIGNNINKYTRDLLPLLFDQLTNQLSDPLVARFCSYTLGMLALKSNSDAFTTDDIHKSEQLLLSVYNQYKSADPTNESSAAAADNGISALGRLIMSHSDQLQLQSTVPIFLSGLPLKVDFSELNSSCAAVANIINTMPNKHADVYKSNQAELTRVLNHVIAIKDVNDKVKQFAQQTLKQII